MSLFESRLKFSQKMLVILRREARSNQFLEYSNGLLCSSLLTSIVWLGLDRLWLLSFLELVVRYLSTQEIS